MGRFVVGFLLASLLWGGVFVAREEGLLDEFFEPDEPLVVAEAPEGADESDESGEAEPEPRRRRRGRRGRRRGMGASMAAADDDYPRGDSTTGDDLGENDPREISAGASGGEAQLSSSQIESVFDASFNRIQRCLVLVPAGAPLGGRLTFGLRIAGSGRVTRVNLRGPSAVTQGEAGSCLRTAARALSFPSFDGPEMLVHYPVTLQ